MIDLYCERLGAGLGAEPLNVGTNIAFFIAAWAGWRFGRKLKIGGGEVKLLLGLILTIGMGSVCFHIFATRWAQALDIIPILAFQLGYLWLYGRKIAGLRPWIIGGILFLYIATALWGAMYPFLLNGSLLYVPSLAILFLMGLYHHRRQGAQPAAILAATGIFLLSLFFRIVDNRLCGIFPRGTHFLWHILNATVLYLMIRAYLANKTVPPQTR